MRAMLELDHLPLEFAALLPHAGQFDPSVGERGEKVRQAEQNQPARQQQDADPIQRHRSRVGLLKRKQYVADADQNAQNDQDGGHLHPPPVATAVIFAVTVLERRIVFLPTPAANVRADRQRSDSQPARCRRSSAGQGLFTPVPCAGEAPAGFTSLVLRAAHTPNAATRDRPSTGSLRSSGSASRALCANTDNRNR